ncbi:hypothetical protein OSB04_031807 [Centaurea solstitialis]|uniref:Uncharacterized protein n=1 Tax=Centaurea solstitialis TaxID=347529 RepID=A0AA38W6D3_9ASTR|nr:hypothetical protein OSB04_031807 [Centaurea solstitialis]
MGAPQLSPTLLWCDNNSTIQIAHNNVFHERTKHIKIDCHFVRQHVVRKTIQLQPISTLDQPANIFTKAHLPGRFRELVSLLKDSMSQMYPKLRALDATSDTMISTNNSINRLAGNDQKKERKETIAITKKTTRKMKSIHSANLRRIKEGGGRAATVNLVGNVIGETFLQEKSDFGSSDLEEGIRRSNQRIWRTAMKASAVNAEADSLGSRQVTLDSFDHVGKSVGFGIRGSERNNKETDDLECVADDV